VDAVETFDSAWLLLPQQSEIFETTVVVLTGACVRRDSEEREQEQKQQTKPEPSRGCNAHRCNERGSHNDQSQSIINPALTSGVSWQSNKTSVAYVGKVHAVAKGR
jgi:hypothetical protein